MGKPIRRGRSVLLCVFSFSTIVWLALNASADNIVSGDTPAPHRGVYEIVLAASEKIENPFFDVSLQVRFTRPDASEVLVDGFFDGARQFKARAYCDRTGQWAWRSKSNLSSLDARSGRFEVVPSSLKGKLRQHKDDPRQFAYDNGEWFLHVGDTGYRYVVAAEPKWRDYIDQTAQMGTTKVRTWFAQSRNNVEALFTPGRKGLDLDYWREIDRRVVYALNRCPHVILQLIPYAEDTEEIKRYARGDKASLLVARAAQARWSAFPNVYWEASNDREVVANGPLKGRQVTRDMISAIAGDMARREPWGTLVTNQQSRGKGYDFVDEDWSDIITLEDLDQVDGARILEYRKKGNDPVVLDEDRYERYRRPSNPRYYFRRLFLASLLSGGHATYGGLRTYEPYGGQAYKSGKVVDDYQSFGARQRGVFGYYDANRAGILSQGAHDFNRIHQFFKEARLTLVGFTPDDARVGNEPRKFKCSQNGKTYLVYLANPDGEKPQTDNPHDKEPKVSIQLPEGTYAVRWYDPRSGDWVDDKDITGGRKTLQAPGPEDWILLIRKK